PTAISATRKTWHIGISNSRALDQNGGFVLLSNFSEHCPISKNHSRGTGNSGFYLCDGRSARPKYSVSIPQSALAGRRRAGTDVPTHRRCLLGGGPVADLSHRSDLVTTSQPRT